MLGNFDSFTIEISPVQGAQLTIEKIVPRDHEPTLTIPKVLARAHERDQRRRPQRAAVWFWARIYGGSGYLRRMFGRAGRSIIGRGQYR